MTKKKKNTIDYTIYDVGSWLEDFDSEQLTKVMNTLSQSRILGNDLNMGIERNSKNQKKSRQRRLGINTRFLHWSMWNKSKHILE